MIHKKNVTAAIDADVSNKARMTSEESCRDVESLKKTRVYAGPSACACVAQVGIV